MSNLVCEYLIVWPPGDSDDPGDTGQRDCGKPATRTVNGVTCCEECYAALLAENDPDLVADVRALDVDPS